MKRQPALHVSDDDKRWTTKIVKGLDPFVRRQVARMFIGFHCDVDVETVPGYRQRLENVAVEAVASARLHDQRDYLVITQRPYTHDLSQQELVSLATVRSIRTLRRF